MDHYLPKVNFPEYAYEWSNYRLARPRLNSRKGDSVKVVDPFHVRSGWFVLDCPSCLIFAGDNLANGTRQQVRSTIEILDLNSEHLA